jgi:hypothetical protein
MGQSSRVRLASKGPRAAAAALLLFAAAPGRSAEPEPGKGASQGGGAAPPASGESWIDETHGLVGRQLADLAARIDDFFGEERRRALDEPGSSLRWRNEFRVDERGSFAYRTSFRATLEVPATERYFRRAHLVLNGESRADPQRPFAEDPNDPAFSPTLTAEQASIELRFPLLESKSTAIDAGGGLRLQLPPDPFVRARLHYHRSLGLGLTGHLTPSIFWTGNDGFGGDAGLRLDRPLAAHTLARWINHAVLSQVTRGVEWATELGLAHEFSSLRTAGYAAAAATGLTRPRAEVSLYRIFLRVRRDVWRRWLFVELEPEIGWPLDPQRGRRGVWALTFRLELHFAGRVENGLIETD